MIGPNRSTPTQSCLVHHFLAQRPHPPLPLTHQHSHNHCSHNCLNCPSTMSVFNTPESVSSLNVPPLAKNRVLMMQDVDEPHKIILYTNKKHIEVNMDDNTLRVLEAIASPEVEKVATPAEVVAPKDIIPEELAEESQDLLDPATQVENTNDDTNNDEAEPEKVEVESGTSSSESDSDDEAETLKKKFQTIMNKRNVFLEKAEREVVEQMNRHVEQKREAHQEALQKKLEDAREAEFGPCNLAVVDVDIASSSVLDIHTSDEETKSESALDTSVLDKLAPKPKEEKDPDIDLFASSAAPVKKRNGGVKKSVKAMHIGNSDEPFFKKPKLVGIYTSQAAAGAALKVTPSEVSRITKGRRTYATSNGKRYWFTCDMTEEFDLHKVMQAAPASKKPHEVKDAVKTPDKTDKRKRIEDSPVVSEISDNTSPSTESNSTSAYSDTLSKRQKNDPKNDIGQDLTPRPLSSRPVIKTDAYKPYEVSEEEKAKKRAARQKRELEAEIFYTPGVIMSESGMGMTCMGHKKKSETSVPVNGECKHTNCLACILTFAQKNGQTPKCLQCRTEWLTWTIDQSHCSK